MRVKHLFVGAAMTAALVICAAAGAATPQQLYVGDFDEQADAPVRMKTGVTNGYVLKAFGGHDFVVECADEIDLGTVKRAAIKGRFPIGKRGSFHARDDDGDTVLNVRGRIGTRKASGTFRFSGQLVGEDGAKHTCDSHKLEWTARLTGEPDVGPSGR